MFGFGESLAAPRAGAWVVGIGLAGLLTATAQEEGAPSDAPAPAAADGAVVVEEKPLRLAVEVDGVFDAVRAHALSAGTEEWATLSVESAVPHGKRVHEGEVLVRFEKKPLEEAIKALEVQVETGRRDLAAARAELEALEQITPMDLKAAARAHAEAADDLDYYENVRRPMSERGVAQGLKAAEFRVENAREELEQLEKMYEADDLTEETEEIILKRARNDVESAEFSLEQQRIAAERTLSTEMKRELRALEEALRRSEIALAATRVSVPAGLEKKRVETAKLEDDLRTNGRKLHDLRRNLEKMELRAPAAGFAYYGEFQEGRMSGAAEAAKKLVRGGKAGPHDVLVSVVESRPLEVRAVIAEDKLAGVVRPGVRGHAFPTSNPTVAIPVKVREVSPVPAVGGGLPMRIVIEGDQPGDGTGIMPGHACRIVLDPVSREQARLIPRSAVTFREGRAVVHRLGEGDAAEEVEIELGTAQGDLVEVRKGLAAGDRIKAKP